MAFDQNGAAKGVLTDFKGFWWDLGEMKGFINAS